MPCTLAVPSIEGGFISSCTEAGLGQHLALTNRMTADAIEDLKWGLALHASATAQRSVDPASALVGRETRKEGVDHL